MQIFIQQPIEVEEKFRLLVELLPGQRGTILIEGGGVATLRWTEELLGVVMERFREAPRRQNDR